MNDDLKREISETILAHAVRKNFEQEMNSFPSDAELAKMYTFSERHEKRMKKLFAKERRREMRKKIYAASKRVAAVFVITVASLFAFLLVNPQLRASFHQIIVEWRDGFTRFKFYDEGTVTEYANWYLADLPEGFKEVDAIYIEDMVSRRYWNEAGDKITFDYSPEGGTLSVDNEHSDYELIEHDGIEYHAFSSISEEYRSKIIWRRDGYRFNLNSLDFGSDDLIKFAASIRQEE